MASITKVETFGRPLNGHGSILHPSVFCLQFDGLEPCVPTLNVSAERRISWVAFLNRDGQPKRLSYGFDG